MTGICDESYTEYKDERGMKGLELIFWAMSSKSH